MTSYSRKTYYIVFIGLIVVSGLGFFLAFGNFRLFSNATLAPPTSTPDRFLPDVTLKDYRGDTLVLSELRGKALVINMWASWCPYCTEELPLFAEIKKEFGDKILILAVNRGEPRETAARFSNEKVPGKDILFLLDPDDSLYRAIGGFSMPETLFVDGEGQIMRQRRGPMQKEELRRRIQDEFHL